MGIFIGSSNRAIRLVAKSKPESSSFDIIEVDGCYSEIEAKELINNFEVRRGILRPKSFQDTSDLRVAFVGVYKIPCGISTYSEWLWHEMIPLVKEYKIFAEHAPGVPEEPNVVRCWSRGRPLTELIRQVREYDPDVIYIQHEYGIFPSARHWLAFMSAVQDIRTITTLHSVYFHQDKTICEAAIPEIVVHSHSCKRILEEAKGVHGKINIIFHGSFPCKSLHKYWNLYQSSHTIVQFGFGFKYKGWERAIEAVARLKRIYPDIFYTGLFSETLGSRDFHNDYFHQLYRLIDDLEVGDHVALIRGFQSETCLDSYLRTNKVALFPYIMNGIDTVYGCSGAARYAMAKGIPVVVSNVPQFEDLEGVVPRCADVSEIVQAISDIFENKDPQQIERQNRFLEENSWKIAARRYLDLLKIPRKR